MSLPLGHDQSSARVAETMVAGGLMSSAHILATCHGFKQISIQRGPK